MHNFIFSILLILLLIIGPGTTTHYGNQTDKDIQLFFKYYENSLQL